MNIVIPLGGIGSRFQKEGYLRPKPFVCVLGKQMILWVLNNLNIGPDDTLVIIYNPEFIPEPYWVEVNSQYPHTKYVTLPSPTRGAAETVLFGLKGLSEAELARPTMLIDGDTFYTADIISKFREISTTHNASFCFEDTQPKPIYSYIKTDTDMNVSEIKEKVKISDHANTGCYSFSNGARLATYCTKIIEKGETQLSQDQKGEFYTSGVIAAMIADGMPCKGILLSKGDFHVLGTPSQVEEFCENWQDKPSMRFAFDLENTLVTAPEVEGDYSTCKPITRNIALAQSLKATGHTIVINVSRGMDAAQGNAAASVAAVGAATLRNLSDFSIPHDEINFSAPHVHFHVGQQNVDPMRDIQKQIGFYPGSATAPPAAPVMCGGAMKQPAVSAEVREIVAGLKAQVQDKSQALGRNGSILQLVLEPVEVMTQVVAGLNYFVKAKVGEAEFMHLKIWRNLQGEAKLVSLLVGKTEADELAFFE